MQADIRNLYPQIYRRCEKVAGVLEAYTGKKVPEQETGFLTFHWYAGYKKIRPAQDIRRNIVLAICRQSAAEAERNG